MRFNTLGDWLSWQEQLNPKEIDLGLERVKSVLEQLNVSANFCCPVITVAGTNGKGSTVAFIESILNQAGISVGCYTSPHLFEYNERIRINQQAVTDQVLCEAFEVIDQARGEIPLTYFEFGTLASLVVFEKLGVEVAVLEVGLGGRLDAVNVIDADVAVITGIDIDHVDWLGDNVESIAREKAGIMRSGKPAVIGFLNPPRSLLDYAQQQAVPLQRLGEDYLYQRLGNRECNGQGNGGWQIKGASLPLDDLPLPALHGGFQLQNAAAAILALSLLEKTRGSEQKYLTRQSIENGLQQVKLAGRYQAISTDPEVIVDVAHNEQAARMLKELLNDNPVSGKTIAVIAMLADKAVAEVLEIVSPEVDLWITAGLSVTRGMAAKNMAQAVRGLYADVKLSACETVSEACAEAKNIARAQLTDDNRIIVFGSFYTVAEATKFFKPNS